LPGDRDEFSPSRIHSALQCEFGNLMNNPNQSALVWPTITSRSTGFACYIDSSFQWA
jgi:hypothetical protein